MVDLFPPAHANLFRYLVNFFREILTHFRTNGTNIEFLGKIYIINHFFERLCQI